MKHNQSNQSQSNPTNQNAESNQHKIQYIQRTEYTTTDDVKVLHVENCFDGFCHVKKYTLQTRLFNGDWSQPYTREILTERFAVGALPYDPRLKAIILIEQFRFGATANPAQSPWLLEVVAGLKDKDYAESDEDLLRREMIEEAGLEIEELIPMYDYFVSPGILTERLKLFCAKVDATKAPKFCGLETENEDIRIHVVPLEIAFKALKNGEINNAAGIIALQWMELNLDKLI